jgi:hypothetical protein
MRYAVVNSDNVVVNVIEAPKDWQVEGHRVIVSKSASSGDTYIDQKFATPAKPEPEPTMQDRYGAATTQAAKLAILAEHVGLVRVIEE